MLKNKKIIVDVILNIFATAIPTFVLQLLILPALARDFSDEKYGLIVTILALFNVVPATFGNALNNIRLLYNDKYKDNKYEGDFNLLLIILSVINFFVVLVFSYVYENTITFVSLVLNILVSVAWLVKEYFIVSFLIKIDYRAILFNNLLQVVGYGLGFMLYKATGYWQLIYLIGYIVSLVYIFSHSSLWKEKLHITPLFKNTSWQLVLLIISGLLGRVTTYADKIFIYPVLGGTLVSIYYVATIFGKVVSLITTPLNSVFLTYLSKVRKRPVNTFWVAFGVGMIISILGYIVCVALSRPILTLLYPQYVDDAMKYIFITTGTTALYAVIAVITPFVLKFFDMKWQIVINGGTAALYVLICMVLLHFFGLYGFCIGAFITNLIKLIIIMVIYLKCKSLTENSEDE